MPIPAPLPPPPKKRPVTVLCRDVDLPRRAQLAATAAGWTSLSACIEAFLAYMAQDQDAQCPRPVVRRYRGLRAPRRTV